MGLNAFQWSLALGMLVTGSINTLSTKAADFTASTNRYGDYAFFSHPFFQAAGMFVGELSCLLVYVLASWRASSRGGETFARAKPHSKLIFVIPALCDLTATSIMYVGLSLTSSSIFQMLRGSVVIFTATFSVLFLKKSLRAHHWVGVALVLVGTAIVGSSSFVCKDAGSGGSSGGDASKAMTGNVLIIIAQVIVAVQMVVEEKLIGGYDIPALQVVGWEGAWGLSIITVLLTIMYYIPTTGTPLCAPNTGPCPPLNVTCTPPVTFDSEGTCSHVEDSWDAFVQIGNDHTGQIGGFTVLNILSIAFFNFFGVSVTKHVNASTRMVLDSLRTMVIWSFSLGRGWETFCYMQVIGFIVLLLGTLTYNELLKVPGLEYLPVADGAEGKDVGEEGEGDDYALLGGSTGSLNAAPMITRSVSSPGTFAVRQFGGRGE